MSIIRVILSPSYLSGPFHCSGIPATEITKPAPRPGGRIMSIIRVILSPSYLSGPFNCSRIPAEITKPAPSGPPGRTHHEHHPRDTFPILPVWALQLQQNSCH